MNRIAIRSDLAELGQRAAVRRRALGITQGQLAETIGIGRHELASWEAGSISPRARLPMFSRWARALHVPESWLAESSRGPIVGEPELSHIALRRVVIRSATASEAIRKVARILARPGFDPWWETTPLIRDQERSVWLFESYYGVHGLHLKSLGALARANGISQRRVNDIIKTMKIRAERFNFVLPDLARVKATWCDLSPTEDFSLFMREIVDASIMWGNSCVRR